MIPVFRECTGADLEIAGDSEYASILKRIADGNSRIRFVGRVAPEQLDRYYRHAIGLVVSSVCNEMFGIILIESMRQGAPVLARHIGPGPEIWSAPCSGPAGFRPAATYGQRKPCRLPEMLCGGSRDPRIS